MPFSFLHAADLHLDTPFASVGGFPAAVGDALREASLEAWTALVDTAIERQVAFVLLAGDLYDGAERGLRAQWAFLDGVARLDAAGIHTLVVHGNHDPVREGWTAIGAFPERVHIFSADQVESVTLEVGGERVVVHGTSYATAAMADNLALRYPHASGGGFHIGLLHANVGGTATGHLDYSPCSLDDLRATGYQYWALGHVHQQQVLQAGEPWIVYPGNLQGRSPKHTERGAKGAVLVHVAGGVASAPEPVVLDRVRFHDVAVSIEPYADAMALLDQLERLADPAVHHGRHLIVRATIEGAGDLHAELALPTRRAEVLDELRRRGTARTPFVWWHGITWRTKPAAEVIDLRRRDDFTADLHRFMDEATATHRGAWRDLLPADVARELGDLLPALDDDEIWAAARQAAADAIAGAEP
ncbi:MAG: DNA repair exonuclease [Acidimicrobiales bacterium]